MSDLPVSSGKPKVDLTSAQRKAAEATNFPHQELGKAVRKHANRVRQACGNRKASVLEDRYWGGDKALPSSRGHFNSAGGRERIFCASIVYFELIDEGSTPESSTDLQEVSALIGRLILAWTYYELPISKIPEVAKSITF